MKEITSTTYIVTYSITLESFRTLHNGERLIKDDPDLKTNIKLNICDSDQVSGYPSNTVASGLSRTTTVSEIISVDGVDKKTMKDNNMNLMYGKVNYSRYCSEVMGLPTMQTFYSKTKEKLAA